MTEGIIIVITAFTDLIRLVHGNSKGLPKLVREFREFWWFKEAGKDPHEAAVSESAGNQQDAKNDSQSELLDTSTSNDEKDKEKDKGTSNDEKDKEKEKEKVTSNDEKDKEKENEKGETEKKDAEKVYSISKRQLDKTIREIAVYEKRAEHNRNCWYVNDATLEKYGLKNLPVPTEWQWITIPQPKKKEHTCSTPTPAGKDASGRLTPAQDMTPKAAACSITKFTVAGITPKVYSPPVKPKPQEVAPTPKISIAALLSAQKASAPKTGTPKTLLEAPKRQVEKKDQALTPSTPFDAGETEDDDDCAIVAIEPKPDKNQPGIMSMFKPKLKPAVPDSTNSTSKSRGVLVKDNAKVVRANDATPKGEGQQAVKKKAARMMSLENVVKKINLEADNLKKQKLMGDKRETAVRGLGTADAPMEID